MAHPIAVLTSYAKTDPLVLDDYCQHELNQEQRHDLLEILEDRNGLKSTLVTSQLPVEHWHEQREKGNGQLTASLRSDSLAGITWNTQNAR